jgi:hypothetical protein
MATGTEVIYKALRLIGAKAQGQTPSAEIVANYLETLNDMLLRWEASGISMGFSPLSDASSTLPIPDPALLAAKYNLAILMAPELGREVAPEVVAIAESSLAALRNDAIPVPRLNPDTPRQESGRIYDITTGQYI